MGRRSHLLFLWGGGGVVRYRGVIKEKSPDFRSPVVGISGFVVSLVDLLNMNSLIWGYFGEQPLGIFIF